MNENIIDKILGFIADYINPFKYKVLTNMVTLVESDLVSMYTENGCIALSVAVPANGQTSFTLCNIPMEYAPRVTMYGTFTSVNSSDVLKVNRAFISSASGEVAIRMTEPLSTKGYITFSYPLRRS